MKARRGMLGQSLTVVGGSVVPNDASRSGTLTADLLAQPAQRAARVIAMAKLDVLHTAFDKFIARDADGLHDLRVALRRLRSWLRAFEPYLDDTLRGKTNRRLRRLARATDAARDLEVWTSWIATPPVPAARERAGHRHLTELFERERDDAIRDATDRLERGYSDVASALADELSYYWLRVPTAGDRREETMAVAVAELLRQHHRQFARKVARADSDTPLDLVHNARIAAKRLRYLLETLEATPRATDTADQLSGLQDLLGANHDMHLLANRIVDELTRLARDETRSRVSEPRDASGATTTTRSARRIRPGMLAVAERAQREAAGAFAEFQRAWDDARLASLSDVIEHVADELGGL